jgi:Type I phosphodiesterase / nucleotide pyrophosphatase
MLSCCSSGRLGAAAPTMSRPSLHRFLVPRTIAWLCAAQCALACSTHSVPPCGDRRRCAPAPVRVGPAGGDAGQLSGSSTRGASIDIESATPPSSLTASAPPTFNPCSNLGAATTSPVSSVEDTIGSATPGSSTDPTSNAASSNNADAGAENPYGGSSASATQTVSQTATAQCAAAFPDGGFAAQQSDAGSPIQALTRTVILISVDGLAMRYVEQLSAAGVLPTFSRLQESSAFTHNARTQSRISVTLPNHISMLTGRPAVDVPGAPLDTAHDFLDNSDPGGCATLHGRNPALSYTRSVFDEVHDKGGYTSLATGKSKFNVVRRSYEPPFGAQDSVGADDGEDKLDDYELIEDTAALVPEFLVDLSAGVAQKPLGPNFAMLHIRDTDSNGHVYGWGSPEYLWAVIAADQWIGDVLDLVQLDPQLEDAVVIVTTDHGGVGTGHYDPQQPETGVIPFYVWGRGVPSGDLYELLQGARVNPGNTFPFDEVGPQPIRNGDVANLALHLLGNAPIAGTLFRGIEPDWANTAQP